MSSSRRSSILKQPRSKNDTIHVYEDYETTTSNKNRRVSFSGKMNVKMFHSNAEVQTLWQKSYEISDHESADNLAVQHSALTLNSLMSENKSYEEMLCKKPRLDPKISLLQPFDHNFETVLNKKDEICDWQNRQTSGFNKVHADEMTGVYASNICQPMNKIYGQKRQSIYFDTINANADLEITKCVDTVTPCFNFEPISFVQNNNQKRLTILYNTNDQSADLELTNVVSNDEVQGFNIYNDKVNVLKEVNPQIPNVLQNSVPDVEANFQNVCATNYNTFLADKALLGSKKENMIKSKRQTIIFDDADIDITQAVVMNENTYMNKESVAQTDCNKENCFDKNKRQMTIFDSADAHADIEITEPVVMEQNASPKSDFNKENCHDKKKRQTIIFDSGDTEADIEITEAVVMKENALFDKIGAHVEECTPKSDFNKENCVKKKRQTIIFDSGDAEADIEITEAVVIKENAILDKIGDQLEECTPKPDFNKENCVKKKRQTIIFDLHDAEADIEITEAVIMEENVHVVRENVFVDRKKVHLEKDKQNVYIDKENIHVDEVNVYIDKEKIENAPFDQQGAHFDKENIHLNIQNINLNKESILHQRVISQPGSEKEKYSSANYIKNMVIESEIAKEKVKESKNMGFNNALDNHNKIQLEVSNDLIKFNYQPIIFNTEDINTNIDINDEEVMKENVCFDKNIVPLNQDAESEVYQHFHNPAANEDKAKFVYSNETGFDKKKRQTIIFYSDDVDADIEVTETIGTKENVFFGNRNVQPEEKLESMFNNQVIEKDAYFGKTCFDVYPKIQNEFSEAIIEKENIFKSVNKQNTEFNIITKNYHNTIDLNFSKDISKYCPTNKEPLKDTASVSTESTSALNRKPNFSTPLMTSMQKRKAYDAHIVQNSITNVSTLDQPLRKTPRMLSYNEQIKPIITQDVNKESYIYQNYQERYDESLFEMEKTEALCNLRPMVPYHLNASHLSKNLSNNIMQIDHEIIVQTSNVIQTNLNPITNTLFCSEGNMNIVHTDGINTPIIADKKNFSSIQKSNCKKILTPIISSKDNALLMTSASNKKQFLRSPISNEDGNDTTKSNEQKSLTLNNLMNNLLALSTQHTSKDESDNASHSNIDSNSDTKCKLILNINSENNKLTSSTIQGTEPLESNLSKSGIIEVMDMQQNLPLDLHESERAPFSSKQTLQCSPIRTNNEQLQDTSDFVKVITPPLQFLSDYPCSNKSLERLKSSHRKFMPLSSYNNEKSHMPSDLNLSLELQMKERKKCMRKALLEEIQPGTDESKQVQNSLISSPGINEISSMFTSNMAYLNDTSSCQISNKTQRISVQDQILKSCTPKTNYLMPHITAFVDSPHCQSHLDRSLSDCNDLSKIQPPQHFDMDTIISESPEMNPPHPTNLSISITNIQHTNIDLNQYSYCIGNKYSDLYGSTKSHKIKASKNFDFKSIYEKFQNKLLIRSSKIDNLVLKNISENVELKRELEEVQLILNRLVEIENRPIGACYPIIPNMDYLIRNVCKVESINVIKITNEEWKFRIFEIAEIIISFRGASLDDNSNSIISHVDIQYLLKDSDVSYKCILREALERLRSSKKLLISIQTREEVVDLLKSIAKYLKPIKDLASTLHSLIDHHNVIFDGFILTKYVVVNSSEIIYEIDIDISENLTTFSWKNVKIRSIMGEVCLNEIKDIYDSIPKIENTFLKIFLDCISLHTIYK